ncbi:MAG: acyltransferase family protein [Pseudomonadota bacterium]
MEAQGRIIWMDMAKGGSILLVVQFHLSYIVGQITPVNQIYWWLNDFLIPIRMPIFFVVSGYFARRSLQLPWRALLQKKTLFYFYIFSVWNVINFGIEAIYYPHLDHSFSALVSSWYKPASILWFIWALMFYFVIAKLGGTKPSQRIVVVLVTLIGFIMVTAEFVVFEAPVHNQVLVFTPFFLFGAWGFDFIKQFLVRRTGLVFLLSTFLYLAVRWAVEEPTGLGATISYFIQAALGVLAASTACILSESIALVRKPLSYIGQNTLPIYVSHVFIANIVMFFLIPEWLLNLRGSEYYMVPLMIVVSCFMALQIKFLSDLLGQKWLFQLPKPLALREHPRSTINV